MIDYPTDKDLDFIKNYDLRELGPMPLVQFLKEIWHWQDYIKHEGNTLELHTGGWSGNEDIIAALCPTAFWLFCWVKSERGGHYYFQFSGA